MQDEVQGKQADLKPWTSTSLAAGLMDNMRHLEEVIFHDITAVWTVVFMLNLCMS